MTQEKFKELEFEYKMSIVRNAVQADEFKNVVLDLNAAPDFFKKTFKLKKNQLLL